MKYFFFVLLSLSASQISLDLSPRKYFVVWNIGQGLWTTWAQPEECWHFDMGGEFFPWTKIQALCGRKLNRVFLSHWDWDHIGALSKAARYLPDICLAAGPLGRSSARKESLLPKKSCPIDSGVWKWQPRLTAPTKSNERSQVFATQNFLVPGDSTQSEEKIWGPLITKQKIQFLVLGHHGSRNSTSEHLLKQLSSLKLAIVSARWKRYRHPHHETLARLQKSKTPVLRTEDWGSLWFEL